MKKLSILLLVIISLIFTSFLYAQDIPGEVWLMPEYAVVSVGQSFITSVHVNTGEQKLSAYGFDIYYDSSLLALDTSYNSGYVTPGPEGFVSVIAAGELNPVRVNGFDENGTGPGINLNVVIIHWIALDIGIVNLDIVVNALSDETGAVIGKSPVGINCKLPVVDTATQFGDMDNSGSIDIVDALLVAQYYVGLIQTLVEPKEGDVNADGLIDIIDALIIAQYYVGLHDELPVIVGLSKQNTEVIPVYPGGVPPVQINPMYSDISVTLRDAYGLPLSDKEISFEGDVRLLSYTAITDVDGVATVTADVPWDGGWDIMRTLAASFVGDNIYAPTVSDIVVREISNSNDPTVGPTLAPTTEPTPFSDPAIAPYYLQESQVTSNVVHGTSATTVSITVTLPDDCKSMTSWGANQLDEYTYTVDTTSEQLIGIPCTQVIVEAIHGYYLGPLDQGDYTFNFYNWGNLVHTTEFTVSN